LAELTSNMTGINGSIKAIDLTNYVEGPWLYKRNNRWYLVYASDSHNGGSEKISYAMANDVFGPYTFKGLVTGTAKNSFTIHPAIIDFKGKSYLFYHNATLTLTVNGKQYGPATGRRSVAIDYLEYNSDGTIKEVTQTTKGVSE